MSQLMVLVSGSSQHVWLFKKLCPSVHSDLVPVGLVLILSWLFRSILSCAAAQKCIVLWAASPRSCHLSSILSAHLIFMSLIRDIKEGRQSCSVKMETKAVTSRVWCQPQWLLLAGFADSSVEIERHSLACAEVTLGCGDPGEAGWGWQASWAPGGSPFFSLEFSITSVFSEVSIFQNK